MRYSTVKIAELVKSGKVAIKTGPFGTQLKASEYVEKGTPVLNVKNLGYASVVRTKLDHVGQDTLERLAIHTLRHGDIVFGRKGAVDRHAFIHAEEDGWMQGSDCIRMRILTDRLNARFLSYYFLTPKHRAFMASMCAHGTTMASLNQKILEQIEVPVLDRAIQDRIVDILSCIDDKIELNQRINENLKQYVKALVNSWFIDYFPFGGARPNNWATIPLSAIADFVPGYSYKGTELQPSSTAMATIKNFDRNGGFKIDGFKELIPSSKIKPYHYAEKFDTLVAHTDLTQKAEVIGNAEPLLNLAGYSAVVFSMDLVKVTPKRGVSKFLLAAILQDVRFKTHCLGYVNGTTVLHLNKKALPEYELDFPTDIMVLQPLECAIKALYTQMANNLEENRLLTKIRDTLLPKLMAGEIEV